MKSLAYYLRSKLLEQEFAQEIQRRNDLLDEDTYAYWYKNDNSELEAIRRRKELAQSQATSKQSACPQTWGTCPYNLTLNGPHECKGEHPFDAGGHHVCEHCGVLS